MGVSDEAKNVIPLKFLRKIKNKIFFPLVNSIRGPTVHFDFDCKIDVQANNPIGLIPNFTISCHMTFVHVGK
jgi:hypothetical protein